MNRGPEFISTVVRKGLIPLAATLALTGGDALVSVPAAYAQDGGSSDFQCPPGTHPVTTSDVESTTTTCESDTPTSPADTPTPAHHQPHHPRKPHHPHGSNRALARDYYRNPFRDVNNLMGRRIDMGVDYSGEGPVKALGEAVVTVVKKHTSSFWAAEGGNVVVYRLKDGPAKGKPVFTSENCTPTVYKGERLHSWTTVCYMHDQAPNIETGWGRGRGYSDKPAAWSVYTPAGNPDGSKTAYGLNFSHLMGALGAPEGNTHAGHVSTHPSRTVGSLPYSFPRWG